MKFQVNIEADNEAFKEAPELEIARILHHVAGQLEAGWDPMPGSGFGLIDANGNKVGWAEFSEDGGA